jgi:hypothetical protein
VITPPGEVNEGEARVLASRYVREVGGSLARSWTHDHGASVEPSALAPCDRALYAATPYAAITGSDVSELTVRTFGAHWIVPMCADGEPQVVVSLSSQARESASNPSSPTNQPSWARADIRSFGIPAGVSASDFTPEGAAQRAFEATGRRVATVPELVMNPMPGAAVLVRWRVGIDAPIALKGTHSAVVRERSSVLVGFGSTFKEAGMFDADPLGAPAALSWTDAVTKKTFSLELSPSAVSSVEAVTPADQRDAVP